MGLAKNTEQTAPVVIDAQPKDGIMKYEFNGIPVDVLRYYGVYMEDLNEPQTKRLKEVCEIVSQELTDPSIGNLMDYLNKIDLKLGATPIGESRVNRVWGYLKLQKNIREMEQRQRAYER